ncbi:hypothetical protein IQ07DRAFT_644749 [Pyrenochaeta sp. DS3sAY3a]|nr:hypothetical protein IQ07DRAFT_644749 [Pyrenochaeta sp. DS3sAY3a]
MFGADGAVSRVGRTNTHTEFACFHTGLATSEHSNAAEYLRSCGVWVGHITEHGKSFDGLPSFENLKRNSLLLALLPSLPYSGIQHTTNAVCGGCLSETSVHIPVTSVKFVNNQKLTIMLFDSYNPNGLFSILLPTSYDWIPNEIEAYRFRRIDTLRLDNFALLAPRKDAIEDGRLPTRHVVLTLMKPAVPTLIVRLRTPATRTHEQRTPTSPSETNQLANTESILREDPMDGNTEERPQLNTSAVDQAHDELYNDPPARTGRQREESILTDASRKRRRVAPNASEDSQTRPGDLNIPIKRLLSDNGAEQSNDSSAPAATHSIQSTPNEQSLEDAGNIPITWRINRGEHGYCVGLSINQCKSFDGLLTRLLGKTKYVGSLANFIRDTVSWRLDFQLLDGVPMTLLYDAGDGSRFGPLKSMIAGAPSSWIRDNLVIQLTPSHLEPAVLRT